MARKALVELIGDPSSLLRSFRQSSNGAQKLERDLKGLAVTAKQSAEAQVQAAVKRDARLRQEITAYRQLASAAKRGSTEQIVAARKAAEAEGRLSRSLGVTAREQRALASSAARTERQLGRATRGTLAGSGALRSMGRSLAFASAGFIGFAAGAQLLRTSIGAASDLTEEINKSNIVFRGSEKQVQSWSKTLLPAFGLTRVEALRTAATFGNMLVPMGFVRRRAAEMSENLVKLAGDMASFNNASPEETLKALQAGLANQPRPLRRFGVFLDQARVAAEALSSGIVKANVNMGKVADAQTKVDIAQAKLSQSRKKYGENSLEAAQAEVTLHNAARGLTSAFAGQIPKLTTAQRTLAIYRLVLKDTADAHGDAARTGNAFAGQMRKLHAEVGNLQEEIGTLLLPTVLKYTRALTDWLGKSENQKRVLRDVKDGVHLFARAAAIVASILPRVARAANHVADALGGWKTTLELLLALKAGSVIARWIAPFAQLGGAAAASKGKISGLRAALLRLPTAITIVVALEILIHDKDFRKKVDSLGKGVSSKINQINDSIAGFLHLPKGGPFRHDREDSEKAGAAAGRAYAEAFKEQARRFNAAALLLRPNAPSPEDVHAGIHSAAAVARQTPAATATADPAATAAAERRRRRQFHERLNATPIVTPLRLQIQEARAEASNNAAAILAAARAIRAWVLRVMKGLHGQRLISAYAILGQANDTIAAAAKEAADKAKAQAEKTKERLAEARRKMQEAQQKLAEAIDNVRQQIGELFQGPVLAPTEQQTKAQLGAPGPKARDLVRDVRGQTALFARFNRDLAQLQKRGAPKELIKELRAQGTAALPEIEALLGASKKIRDEFFKAFRARERLVQRVAKVEMRAQNVVLHARNLHVSGGRLRKMAEGGIATGPTAALVGESGPEAVIPLSRLGGHGGPTDVYLDGDKISRNQRRHAQRRRGNTVSQVRGRNPGTAFFTD